MAGYVRSVYGKEEDWEQIDRAAKALGQSMGGWMMEAARRRLEQDQRDQLRQAYERRLNPTRTETES